MKRGKLLIVGYPCSGTKFMVELLKSYGIVARHEKSHGNITVSWRHAGEPDKEWVERPVFDNVLHQVRHPLKVLASIGFTIDDRSENIFRHNCPGLGEERDLEFYMKTYVQWDKLIRELNPVLRYQIEQLESVWPEICRYVELPIDTVYRDKNVDRNSHNTSNFILTWDDLEIVSSELTEQIFDLAKVYGYE